jgi:hypothetical protein
MKAPGPTRPLPCLAVALGATACALGQVFCAVPGPKPDRNPTGSGAIGSGDRRLSVTESDHAVVARDPQPSI